jgi:hypothetical protein
MKEGPGPRQDCPAPTATKPERGIVHSTLALSASVMEVSNWIYSVAFLTTWHPCDNLGLPAAPFASPITMHEGIVPLVIAKAPFTVDSRSHS